MQDASKGIMDGSRLGALVACSMLTLAGFTPALADEDLFDLSLEQLMTLEVTSVSRTAEALVDAPAAVYVITGEQIRNAGVSTIPDALRMAPGVHVAQIDANKWAVSARGFNGRFANKLLVLIDGRSVYTPLFSGVFWDIQDTLLEDIERIEVIRGPGATLWGANAVNGVINIITRSAADTVGGLFAVGHGNLENGYGVARYGGTLGDSGHYRIYGKYFDRDGHVNFMDGTSSDGWNSVRAGTRLDWTTAASDDFVVSAEIFDVTADERIIEPTLQPPYIAYRDSRQEVSGAHALLRWERDSGNRHSTAQLSWSMTDRDSWLFGERRDTIDLDFQQQFQIGDRHDFVWGTSYRYTTDEIDASFAFSTDPAERSTHLYSFFVQDRIALTQNWQLTVGSKFEHNSYTGYEVQPNIRLLGTLSDNSRLWASISSAVRVPSRAERDGSVVPTSGVLPPGTGAFPLPVPAVVLVQGNGTIDSEDLLAYELGYRWQASDSLSVDVALFRNEYDRPGTSSPVGEPFCAPSEIVLATNPACVATASHVVVPIDLGAGYSAQTQGIEISTDYRPSAWWQLVLQWSWLDDSGDSSFSSNGQQNASHIGSLRSTMQFGNSWALHSALRYVGDVPSISIDGYLAFDLRIAWQVNDQLELSLNGRALNDPEHPEFVSEFGDVPTTGIRRGVYLQALWDLDPR